MYCRTVYSRTLLVLFAGVLAMATRPLFAQTGSPSEKEPAFQDAPAAGFDRSFDMSANSGETSDNLLGARVHWRGWFEVERGQESGRQNGRLYLTALIQPGWYIYSTTQPEGGPRRTVIQVNESQAFELVDDFTADRDPDIHTDSVFPGVRIEQLAGEVTWTAPIRLANEAAPESLQIQIIIDGQACAKSGACELINNAAVTAEFAGYYEPKTRSQLFQDPSGHVTITGHIEPEVAAPGDTVKLVLTANLAPSWHVYRYAPTDPKKISKPTLVVLRKTAGWTHGTPEASARPVPEETGLEQEPTVYYHEGEVSWTTPINVPSDAAHRTHEIAGAIAYQTCTPSSCDIPSAARFDVAVTVAKQAGEGRKPLTFTAGTYAQVAEDAGKTAKAKAAMASDEESEEQRELIGGSAEMEQSTAAVLAIAFLAGLILNVMPCVLPVIGLKIMSFVHQAGGSHREILALNLWFSLGLLSVFWILGAGAAFAGHTWGEHFGDARFLITMIGIVFAFGLSFLGVWEIPIPGFVGSGAMQGAAQREGAMGAFSKGVLSTILATPCAGPLIAPTVAWAVKQPASLTLSAFTFLGLGMAAPYLLVGAVPQLVNMLPKPGPWMDVFKQLMGFVLMGTVIFLFLSVPPNYVIPTLALLWAIGVACWLVGRTPLTVGKATRSLTWSGGLTVIAAISIISFSDLSVLGFSQTHEVDWQPFSKTAVERHLEDGKTVMVDFTADWCATCKYNETVVLNSANVARHLAENGIVAIKADKTQDNPEIDAFLEELGNPGAVIPFLAIFPGDGSQPTTFDGPLTRKKVLDALKRAGSSKPNKQPSSRGEASDGGSAIPS